MIESTQIPEIPDTTERRRVPRLSLASEQFRLTANGQLFAVVDLSTTGMALRVLEREDLILFPIGRQVQGLLNLRRQKYEVNGRVRRLTGAVVGLEFEDLKSEVQVILDQALDPDVLGKQLRPIPAPESRMLWYHSGSGADVLFWRGLDGKYVRFTVFVLGHYVQWEEEQGLTTGIADRLHDQQGAMPGVVRLETMTLTPDLKPDSGKLKIANRLLLSSNLPEELKSWSTRQLKIRQ